MRAVGFERVLTSVFILIIARCGSPSVVKFVLKLLRALRRYGKGPMHSLTDNAHGTVVMSEQSSTRKSSPKDYRNLLDLVGKFDRGR